MTGRLRMIVAAIAGAGALATSAFAKAPLPPELPWTGPSEALIAAPGDPWITPAEREDFRRTPSHLETRAWLERLEQASPLISLTEFGRTAEGRALYYVRASNGKGTSTGAGTGTDSGPKPVVLVQAGIHAHEIDGKDAGLMLLRDIALGGKAGLLDKVDLVFVPIYNIDGHERAGPYNAPHLRGPDNPGTRNTAQGINLNRDYAKADAPETRAMLRLLRAFDPVLYIDVHVSDGFDHGYDVTYTYAGWGRYVQSRAITRWLSGPFESAVNSHLRAMGHNPHFYPSAIDKQDITKGLRVAAEGPRYSTGYGDYARIPTVLVEMHNLKPFRQRVLGAYAMIEGALRAAADNLEALQSAIAADRAARPATLVVEWERDETPLETIPFTGVAYEHYLSPASGAEEIRYLGRTEEWQLPVIGQRPVASITLPAAWWVPASETRVAELLDLHGIAYERSALAQTLALDVVTMRDARLAEVYDTRVRMAGEAVHEIRAITMPAGSLRVPYDQPRGLLAAALLEPEAVDSLFSWGFFHRMIEPPGRLERYNSLPIAEALLAQNPALRRAFAEWLSQGGEQAADPGARLDWLLANTPYGGQDMAVYPIGRELGTGGNGQD
ncbi:MAG: M14 family metallopeptidase [Erythrobacter sp.]